MSTQLLRTSVVQEPNHAEEAFRLGALLPFSDTKQLPVKDSALTIAVLIPCLNEKQTVAKVVQDFRARLPEAQIYVFDNGSTDGTAEAATQAGAIVMREARRGKGYVVQSMFLKVEADIYVMVDGDDTYPAEEVHALIAPVVAGDADMVVGSRLMSTSSEFHHLNRFGNELFLFMVNGIFGTALTDILSGYRVMHRRFVKGVPLFQAGFETEIELTMKALARGYRVQEVPTTLRSRPVGSNSKIRLLKDGARILSTLVALFRDYKPLTVFGFLGVFLIAVAIVPGLIAAGGFLRSGVLPPLPITLFCVGTAFSGLLAGTVGLILHTIDRRFQELEYFARIIKK